MQSIIYELLEERERYILETGMEPSRINVPKSAKSRLDAWVRERAEDPWLESDTKAKILELADRIFGMDVVVREGPIEAEGCRTNAA